MLLQTPLVVVQTQRYVVADTFTGGADTDNVMLLWTPLLVVQTQRYVKLLRTHLLLCRQHY